MKKAHGLGYTTRTIARKKKMANFYSRRFWVKEAHHSQKIHTKSATRYLSYRSTCPNMEIGQCLELEPSTKLLSFSPLPPPIH